MQGRHDADISSRGSQFQFTFTIIITNSREENKQMETKVGQYILNQPSDRQSVMTAIHSIIVQKDKTVVPVIEPMMGKEMIVYKGKGMMKY